MAIVVNFANNATPRPVAVSCPNGAPFCYVMPAEPLGLQDAHASGRKLTALHSNINRVRENTLFCTDSNSDRVDRAAGGALHDRVDVTLSCSPQFQLLGLGRAGTRTQEVASALLAMDLTTSKAKRLT